MSDDPSPIDRAGVVSAPVLADGSAVTNRDAPKRTMWFAPMRRRATTLAVPMPRSREAKP